MEFPGLDDDEQVIPELTTPSAMSMGGTDSVLATVRRIGVLIFLPQAVVDSAGECVQEAPSSSMGQTIGAADSEDEDLMP